MSSVNSASPVGPGRIEFVLLVSVVMMIVAFAIDSMLPALPAIGSSLGVADESRWPLVISAFLAGFGVSQLFVGMLSDRYGRRSPILWAIFFFGVTSLAASLAPTFEHLLVARFVQGIGCAGARVIVTSIVRDRYAGREMAQVMSLASMVFMAAPILAPTMGQIVLAFATWRWIFAVLAMIGVAVWIWVMVRMPETLAPENRTAISVASAISPGPFTMQPMTAILTPERWTVRCLIFAVVSSRSKSVRPQDGHEMYSVRVVRRRAPCRMR